MFNTYLYSKLSIIYFANRRNIEHKKRDEHIYKGRNCQNCSKYYGKSIPYFTVSQGRHYCTTKIKNGMDSDAKPYIFCFK